MSMCICIVCLYCGCVFVCVGGCVLHGCSEITVSQITKSDRTDIQHNTQMAQTARVPQTVCL